MDNALRAPSPTRGQPQAVAAPAGDFDHRVHRLARSAWTVRKRTSPSGLCPPSAHKFKKSFFFGLNVKNAKHRKNFWLSAAASPSVENKPPSRTARFSNDFLLRIENRSEKNKACQACYVFISEMHWFWNALIKNQRRM